MLYLIRGVPGSGKSTKARELLEQGLATVHLEADMYFEDEEGNYKFEPTKIGRAHSWCLYLTRKHLEEGHNVVVSNTFIKRWELAKYVALGFPYEIIECKGSYESVHGVPAEVVARMKANYQELE